MALKLETKKDTSNKVSLHLAVYVIFSGLKGAEPSTWSVEGTVNESGTWTCGVRPVVFVNMLVVMLVASSGLWS